MTSLSELHRRLGKVYPTTEVVPVAEWLGVGAADSAPVDPEAVQDFRTQLGTLLADVQRETGIVAGETRVEALRPNVGGECHVVGGRTKVLKADSDVVLAAAQDPEGEGMEMLEAVMYHEAAHAQNKDEGSTVTIQDEDAEEGLAELSADKKISNRGAHTKTYKDERAHVLRTAAKSDRVRDVAELVKLFDEGENEKINAVFADAS